MVIDLDPQDVPFAETVKAAVAVRRVLNKIGAEGVCKTSGKRGLHVYVPMGKKYTFGQAKMLAELVALLVNRALPETTSLDPRTEHRRSRIYLDTTRNARGQAVAAPYSARPHPGATVSTPLKWSEVGSKLDPAKFTIKTMPGRIEKVGDLWQAALGRTAANPARPCSWQSRTTAKTRWWSGHGRRLISSPPGKRPGRFCFGDRPACVLAADGEGDSVNRASVRGAFPCQKSFGERSAK